MQSILSIEYPSLLYLILSTKWVGSIFHSILPFLEGEGILITWNGWENVLNYPKPPTSYSSIIESKYAFKSEIVSGFFG